MSIQNSVNNYFYQGQYPSQLSSRYVNNAPPAYIYSQTTALYQETRKVKLYFASYTPLMSAAPSPLPAPVLFIDETPPQIKTTLRVNDRCLSCNNKTIIWRNGEEGPKTLCNSCGTVYLKRMELLKEAKAKKAEKSMKNRMHIYNVLN